MSTAGLLVHKPGPLSLIQDLGRYGHFRRGLTVGGPADRLSFLWANRLCGNRADTPALEITLGGVELEATAPCQIALAGGETEIHINGAAVAHWCCHNLNPGDRLGIAPLSRGLRVYLAVSGGFQVEKPFGSAATVLRERIGGSLATGDLLPLLSVPQGPRFWLPPALRPPLLRRPVLRLVPGWQYRELPRELRQEFFSRVFTVSKDSDRMGVRLEGAPLAGSDTLPGEMVSEGIVAGVVQVPPAGRPIVMMNDHQTMGGYPKLGTVLSVDLWQLAQLRPGESLGFAPVSCRRGQDIARRLFRQYESTAPISA